MTKELTIQEYVSNIHLWEENWKALDVPQRREVIEEFQRRVEELALTSPYDPNITHWMGTGTYGREAFAQAGAVLVGAIYKEPQINVLIKGKVLVATEQKVAVMEAPLVFISDPNTKKVGYVIEDMQWITIMSRDNSSIDPESILNEHITEEYEGE